MKLWLVLLALLPLVSPSRAESVIRDCRAVHELAEIELDADLILNVVEDKENDICKFYVALPPFSSRGTAAQSAVDGVYPLDIRY